MLKTNAAIENYARPYYQTLKEITWSQKLEKLKKDKN